MNKLPLGTKVKVISAQVGAYGANGEIGTIVNTSPQSGLGCSDGSESEVSIQIEGGKVWGIGMWDKIELEVVKPIYNKAQQKCIKKWNDAFEYRNVTKPDFARFIDEFNAIDPTPDPAKTYTVRLKNGSTNYTNLTKEEADEKLLKIIPGLGLMSELDWGLVNFNAGEQVTIRSKVVPDRMCTYVIEEES